MCHFTMCCSRKYPCPSHGRLIFSWTHRSPHSSGNSIFYVQSYFHSKHCAFETSLPLGISLNLSWGGHGYFLELYMYLLHTWIRNFHILHQNKVPIELAEGIKYTKTYVQSCNLLLLSCTVSHTISHTVSNLINISPAFTYYKNKHFVEFFFISTSNLAFNKKNPLIAAVTTNNPE